MIVKIDLKTKAMNPEEFFINKQGAITNRRENETDVSYVKRPYPQRFPQTQPPESGVYLVSEKDDPFEFTFAQFTKNKGLWDSHGCEIYPKWWTHIVAPERVRKSELNNQWVATFS